jgi:hypothetical protein
VYQPKATHHRKSPIIVTPIAKLAMAPATMPRNAPSPDRTLVRRSPLLSSSPAIAPSGGPRRRPGSPRKRPTTPPASAPANAHALPPP